MALVHGLFFDALPSHSAVTVEKFCMVQNCDLLWPNHSPHAQLCCKDERCRDDIGTVFK